MIEVNEEPYFFNNDEFEITVSTARPIPEEIGKIVAFQLHPCGKNVNKECSNDWESHTSRLQVRDCSEKKLQKLY